MNPNVILIRKTNRTNATELVDEKMFQFNMRSSVLFSSVFAGLIALAGAQYTAHLFDQPIDHFPNDPRYAPHTKATFKQRYFFDSTYYKPGGPVYLYIGGETSAESRFSNLETGIIQILMQATNGLGIILENRYYGESFPFNTSTTDQIVYLTTEQTIADNAYFAQRATFPGIPGNLTSPGTPWILYGGSLAGGQTAFSIKAHGDVLYGGIAASAPVNVVLEYPEWYAPIQKFAPQDCVQRINGIVDKLDYLIATNQTDAVNKFKAIFGLETLADIRDFAMTIAFPMGGPMNYPTNTWQELSWVPEVGPRDFFYFCGNVTNVDAPANITAVDYALAKYTGGEPWTGLGGYADYVKKIVLPICTTACTELGVYQVAPKTGPSLISRVLQVDYTQQWCDWGFPAGKYNSISPNGPDLDITNSYGGFNFKADRLAFIDGSKFPHYILISVLKSNKTEDTDVWLDVCYHSNFAPPRVSSDLHPELLIAGAGHHWDSTGILDVEAEPQFIREAHLWEIRTVQKWLKAWKAPGKGGYNTTS
ncbi:hypothetical protein B7494_g612 [Chlorociboria aeruginascens]|nr:hypothetical protein B7494_g612 [Chlorociboria aeruginascens]